MTTKIEPIRGKVARVLNAREVAINRGEADGVESGMEFAILSSDVQEVSDPDTNEYLGSIQRPKASVRVTLVYDRMSVAETFKTRRVNVGGTGVGIGLFYPPKWEDRHETLRLKDASLEEIDESDSYVSTGDPVVQAVKAAQFAERETIHVDATR